MLRLHTAKLLHDVIYDPSTRKRLWMKLRPSQYSKIRHRFRSWVLFFLALSFTLMSLMGVASLFHECLWFGATSIFHILIPASSLFITLILVETSLGLLLKTVFFDEYIDQFESFLQTILVHLSCFSLGFYPLYPLLRSIFFSHIQMLLFFFSKLYSIVHTVYHLNQIVTKVKEIDWDIPNTQLFLFFTKTRTCEGFLSWFIDFWYGNYLSQLPAYPLELVLLAVPLSLWLTTLLFVTEVHFFTVLFSKYIKRNVQIEWQESFEELWRFFTEVDSFGIIFLPMLGVEFVFWFVYLIYPYPGFERIRSVEFVYNMAIVIEVFLAASMNLSPLLAWVGIRLNYISFFLTPLGGMPGYNELKGHLGRSLAACMMFWYDSILYVAHIILQPIRVRQQCRVLTKEICKKHPAWNNDLSSIITDFTVPPRFEQVEEKTPNVAVAC